VKGKAQQTRDPTWSGAWRAVGDPFVRALLSLSKAPSEHEVVGSLTIPLRVATCRGLNKEGVAVAASILTSAYSILRDGVPYRDLGIDHLDRRDRGQVARRLAKRIVALGFSVDLRPGA
jgi:hypothetical protein